MKNSNRVEIDGRNRKIIFRGECTDVLDLCAAACCRNDWRISLTAEEFMSGIYQADTICKLTTKACDKKKDPCKEKIFQLKKNDDGACVHLNDHNLCAIYDQRPQVCRNFSCAGGWRFGSVFPSKKNKPVPTPRMEKDVFKKKLSDRMVFVTHPLLILHVVLISPEKKEIIFIKEMAGRCGKFFSKDELAIAQLNEESVIALTALFSNKKTLFEVYETFCDHKMKDFSKKDFSEMIWLLNKHNIILEIGNFGGFLNGAGWL